MATQTTASERILDAITSWEGVHTGGRRGELSIKLGTA